MVPRIGLVGYNCASGLGEKNRQMARWLNVDHWLVKPHKRYPTLSPHPDIETIVCRRMRRKIEMFLKKVDIVLFDETPYYDELIRLCRKFRKRMVCVPAMEWLPFPGQEHVDLFLCPTFQCYRIVNKEFNLPGVYFPWPVDTERFRFKLRKICRRFLFINGHGGWMGRKGGDVIRKAKKLWREMPLVVRSQKEVTWPEGTVVLPSTESNVHLYDEGDVLIAPHHLDGTGLEPMEAMACGMPVITTDGEPWNEIPSLASIPARVERRHFRRDVDWYEPNPEALVAICKTVVGKSIEAESRSAYEWADSRAFVKRAETMIRLIQYGLDEPYTG
jgi:glycosyltransferase involved in cell wall biosynthesis